MNRRDRQKHDAFLFVAIGYIALTIIMVYMVLNNKYIKTCNENLRIQTEIYEERIDSLHTIISNDTVPDIVEWMDDMHMDYGDTIAVYATMYHPVMGQCDASPDVTADQTRIPNIDSCSHLNWIAVSQDLLWFNNGPIRYGDTVYIIAGHKTGWYVVHDAMNKRYKKKIDFLESVGTEAYRYKKAKLHINS